MKVLKQIVLSGLALVSGGCASSLSYEEQVIAYNDKVRKPYEACLATLEPSENGGFMSMVGDGMCTYSQHREGAAGKKCSAGFRRTTSALTSPRRSCQPYHAVSDSNGKLMLEESHDGVSLLVVTVFTRELSDAEHWQGDLFCRSRDKQKSFSDVQFEPYELPRDKNKRWKPKWSQIGWRGVFPDSETEDIGNLRDFRGYRMCQIFWRYPNRANRYTMVLAKLGYF